MREQKAIDVTIKSVCSCRNKCHAPKRNLAYVFVNQIPQRVKPWLGKQWHSFLVFCRWDVWGMSIPSNYRPVDLTHHSKRDQSLLLIRQFFCQEKRRRCSLISLTLIILTLNPIILIYLTISLGHILTMSFRNSIIALQCKHLWNKEPHVT